MLKHVQSMKQFGNPVKGKIQCIYECEMLDIPTEKLGRTTRKRLATTVLNPYFEKDLNDREQTFIVSGKMDGTCCRIHNGKLQKRRDIKKNRKVPQTWEQTSDEFGHLIGFMPLEKGDKWHLDTLSPDKKSIRTLIYNGYETEIEEVPLKKLEGLSVEVMGPKWQKNPHKLDEHLIIVHGTFHLKSYPKDFNFEKLKEWFLNDKQCEFFEGIVVHFSKGNIYKLHRHHLDIPVNGGYPSLMDYH